MVADELLVHLRSDRGQFWRGELGKWKLQGSFGCGRRDVLVFVFSGECINPNWTLFDSIREIVSQKGLERVHLVFARKLEKDLSISQLGQLEVG